MKMNDIMIDLETLGNTADAPIIQIGAVWFGRDGTTGPEMELTLDFDSACTRRRVDGGTVAWWMRQPDEARQAVLGGKFKTKMALGLLTFFVTGQGDRSADFERALQRLSLPVDYQPPSPNAKIWSVGFNDAVQLESLYALYRMPCPWMFYNTRDCRTIEDISPISRLEGAEGYPDGVQHTALSDALYQVK